MTSLYTHETQNIRKTWIIMVLFLIVVVSIGYGVAYYFGNIFFLIIAAFIAIVMNIWAFWYSDTFAIKSARAVPADKTQYRDLHNIVENLAITAGLPKPRVYIINDNAPNAFATGRDAKHAAVAVTTGLLAILNKTELEGVIAHELSHVGNRDILVMSVVVILVGFIAILADIMWRVMLFGGSNRERGSSPWALAIGIALIIVGPIAARLMQMAVSRKREFLADASGAMLTRYPEGLASALEKISGSGQAMSKASSATAHMFISNPFGPKSKKGGMLRRLFDTHPPMEERIAALLG